MFPRAVSIAGLYAAMGFLFAGCAPSASTQTAPPAPTSDVPAIQQSPVFVAASASFRAGAVPAALTQIETLQKRADLSPADRLYLDKQATICRAAMNRSTTPIAVGAASPPIVASPATADSRKTKFYDCGARALLLVCRDLDVAASLTTLTKAAHTRPGVGSSLAGLSDAARSVGLSTSGVQVDADALRRVPTPAIAWVDGNHFVEVTRVKDDTATIHDPNKNGKEEVALGTLLGRSGGVLLLVKRSQPGATKPQK